MPFFECERLCDSRASAPYREVVVAAFFFFFLCKEQRVVGVPPASDSLPFNSNPLISLKAEQIQSPLSLLCYTRPLSDLISTTGSHP